MLAVLCRVIEILLSSHVIITLFCNNKDVHGENVLNLKYML